MKPRALQVVESAKVRGRCRSAVGSSNCPLAWSPRRARGRKKEPKSTIPDYVAAQRSDLVQRDLTAACPNQRWAADLTYFAVWLDFVLAALAVGHSAQDRRQAHSSALRSDLALHSLDTAFEVAIPHGKGTAGQWKLTVA